MALDPTVTRDPGRLAFVGADSQLWVISPDGTGRAQVTFPKLAGPLMSWGGTGGEESRTWPCWSPDGRWLACFQTQGADDGGGPSSVCVVEVDGVEERELVTLNGALPIYLRWSPDGAHIAVLAQEEDELQLSVCSLDRVGHRRVVDEGVPLFFTWTPGDRRLLIHVGSRHDAQGRLVVRDALGPAEDRLYPDPPGSFCTPMFLGDRSIYVTGTGRNSEVCIADVDGKGARRIATLPGLLAVIPSPAGGDIAVASAPRGESTPYKGIWLTNAEGQVRRLVDLDCTAFFWAPDGRRIVLATLDAERNAMAWSVVDVATGEVRRLAWFWPSRDQLFFLHFFEQYAGSHSIFSPDGRLITYGSHPRPGGSEFDRSPVIFVLDLDDPDAAPRPLADGSFSVFAPPDVVQPPASAAPSPTLSE